MKELLQDEWEVFLDCYENEKYQALRVNELKYVPGACDENTVEAFDQRVLKAIGLEEIEPVPWAKHGYYYPTELRPGRQAYHEMGVYYIQEPSAMSAAGLLDAKPGEYVLDLCSAPGGKATQLAAAMHGKGLLVANEIHPARCKILSQNIERMGITNALVTNEDPHGLAPHFPLFFDKILVDAPCSGEGMFRKNPDAMAEWSLEQVDICADRQADILEQAAMMLKQGGRLVYSTCTFSPQEDEMAIAAFLTAHPEFEVEKVPAPYFEKAHAEWANVEWENAECAEAKCANAESANAERADKGSADTAQEYKADDRKNDRKDDTDVTKLRLEDTFRLWPHKLHGEGHYVAVLRKKAALNEAACDEISNQGEAACQRSENAEYRQKHFEKKNSKKNSLNKSPKNASKNISKNSSDKNGNGILNKDQQASFQEFCTSVLTPETQAWIMDSRLILFGDNLYRLPVGISSLAGLKVERPGLHIGTFKKNRFEPAHALALSLNVKQITYYVNMKCSDERTRGYFRGEGFFLQDGDVRDAVTDIDHNKIKGFCPVFIDGFCAGWGKIAGGQLKNHYPKGLRKEVEAGKDKNGQAISG